MKKITPYIDEEYFDLIPRPQKESESALKQSIKDEGQLVPIIINSKGKIIDGHTRYEICRELGITVKYEIQNFVDESEEKEYALLTNIKRRHLTPVQIAFLIDDMRDKWKTIIENASK